MGLNKRDALNTAPPGPPQPREDLTVLDKRVWSASHPTVPPLPLEVTPEPSTESLKLDLDVAIRLLQRVRDVL